LYKKQDFRAVLISMEAGARMKEHDVDGTSSVQILRRHIRYSAEGQTYDLEAMSLLTVGASINRDVEAIEPSVFLLTISWPSQPAGCLLCSIAGMVPRLCRCARMGGESQNSTRAFRPGNIR
jgi:hypothetical protein